MIELKRDDFSVIVTGAKVPVLVDFWAQWCVPCRKLTPILNDLATKYKNKILFTKMDIEEGGEIPAKFGVSSVPTVIIFNGGAPVTSFVGVKRKEELEDILNEVLGQ